MIAIRWIIYAVALPIYIARLALFFTHSFLLFLTKPGSAFIVPLILFLALFVFQGYIDPHLQPIRHYFAEKLGWRALRYNEEGYLAAAGLVSVAAFVSIAVAGMLMRSILMALPAPRRPLKPLEPLHARDPKLKTRRARIAVKPLKGRRRALPRSAPTRRADPAPEPMTTTMETSAAFSVTTTSVTPTGDPPRRPEPPARADRPGGAPERPRPVPFGPEQVDTTGETIEAEPADAAQRPTPRPRPASPPRPLSARPAVPSPATLQKPATNGGRPPVPIGPNEAPNRSANLPASVPRFRPPPSCCTLAVWADWPPPSVAKPPSLPTPPQARQEKPEQEADR